MTTTKTQPKEWKETTLGEVAEVFGGFAFRGEDFSDEKGFPIVKITDIKSPYVDIENAGFVDSGKYEQNKIKKFLLSRGDYLVAMTGATIGKVGRIKSDKKAYLNQRVAKIDAVEGQSYKDFIYYTIFSDNFSKFIQRFSSGSSAQQNISATDIGKFEILLPSLPEQHEIAAVLLSLDDKIELLKKQNETLEQIARAIFHEWFVEFNFPDEKGRPYKASGGKMVESELGEIPEGWEIGTLENEFKIIMGQSPAGETFNSTGEGIIFFQGRTDFGIRFPKIRLYTTEPTRIAEPFDVLVSVRAPVGDINVAIETSCIGRGLASVRGEYKSYTLYKILSIQKSIKAFDDEGTIFGSINKTDFGNIGVIIPPKSFTKFFENTVQFIDKKITNNSYESMALGSIRDTLLPRLMSGEVRVQV